MGHYNPLLLAYFAGESTSEEVYMFFCSFMLYFLFKNSKYLIEVLSFQKFVKQWKLLNILFRHTFQYCIIYPKKNMYCCGYPTVPAKKYRP